MEEAGSALQRSRTQMTNPLWLNAEVTFKCPLHCVFCYNPVDYTRFGAGADHRRVAARAARRRASWARSSSASRAASR